MDHRTTRLPPSSPSVDIEGQEGVIKYKDWVCDEHTMQLEDLFNFLGLSEASQVTLPPSHTLHDSSSLPKNELVHFMSPRVSIKICTRAG
jgi:hypothetical protein